MTLPLRLALIISGLGHLLALILLSGTFQNWFQEPPEQTMQVQLISMAPPAENPKVEQDPQPAPNIKTQASAAPREAPDNMSPQPKPKTATEAPKIKVKEKPEPKPKPQPKPEPKPKPKKPKKSEEKPKKEAQPRPPKLDKTPDKTKAVRNTREDAKTVQEADDFAAAMDFLDDVEPEKTPIPEAPKDELQELLRNEQEQAGEINADIARIKQHIQKNWRIPAGIRRDDNLALTVEVRLKPDGTVQQVKVLQSSGKGFFDDSLVRGVYKASPLPIPRREYDTFRVIELRFGN